MPAGRPRFADVPPVWDIVEAKIRADGQYPLSFFALLVIAGLIGAVGILTNSQILIVAAMVVGPEYGAIMATALGIAVGAAGLRLQRAAWRNRTERAAAHPRRPAPPPTA
jgi:hypothetical protein